MFYSFSHLVIVLIVWNKYISFQICDGNKILNIPLWCFHSKILTSNNLWYCGAWSTILAFDYLECMANVQTKHLQHDLQLILDKYIISYTTPWSFQVSKFQTEDILLHSRVFEYYDCQSNWSQHATEIMTRNEWQEQNF